MNNYDYLCINDFDNDFRNHSKNLMLYSWRESLPKGCKAFFLCPKLNIMIQIDVTGYEKKVLEKMNLQNRYLKNISSIMNFFLIITIVSIILGLLLVMQLV